MRVLERIDPTIIEFIPACTCSHTMVYKIVHPNTNIISEIEKPSLIPLTSKGGSKSIKY